MSKIGGPARGLFEPRTLGTRVEMAGRPMFLPKTDVPLVQQLTLEQIKAIPKDRFAVAVIEQSAPSIPLMTIRKGRGGTMPSLRRLQRPNLGGTKNVFGYVSKMPHDLSQIEIDGTKTFNTIISKLKEVIEDTESVQDTYHVALMNQKNDPKPNSGIFFELINENDLADCIRKIIKCYFGTRETCKIMGKEYKLAEFCVLMHFYFIRIGILENLTRLQFYNYLKKKVFDGVERFTAKTFNNYGNEFEHVKGNFTHADWKGIDFETRPDPSGKPIQDAFQEIGFAFQNSQFFKQLKKQKERMAKLLI